MKFCVHCQRNVQARPPSGPVSLMVTVLFCASVAAMLGWAVVPLGVLLGLLAYGVVIAVANPICPICRAKELESARGMQESA